MIAHLLAIILGVGLPVAVLIYALCKRKAGDE